MYGNILPSHAEIIHLPYHRQPCTKHDATNSKILLHTLLSTIPSIVLHEMMHYVDAYTRQTSTWL